MKSIFITSFHPFISRNILQTGILKSLAEKHRVHVLCPDYKASFFKETFNFPNVHIIGVTMIPLGRFEKIWKEFGNCLLRTSTIRMNRKERYDKDGKMTGYFLFLLLNGTLARVKLIRKAYEVLGKFVFYGKNYELLLKKHMPELVFSTDIFHDEDVRMLATAKKLGIFSIGMVRSWDNCTNKGILPIVPSSALVHNNVIKGELREIHLFPKEKKIEVSGIPQFDYYLNYKPKDPLDFYKFTGFSTERKVILFAPTGFKFVEDDWFLLQVIHDAVKTGDISGNPQILVRFPPGDSMDLSKVTLSNDVSVHIDYPGVEFNKGFLKDRELSEYDMLKLADTLYYSDVLVSVGSTLCIDIACFDKPIICPNVKAPDVPYNRSMVKMYEKHQYAYLLRTGACSVPHTKEELIASIQNALENKDDKKDGRAQLVEEQVGKLDGLASQRITNYISKCLA